MELRDKKFLTPIDYKQIDGLSISTPMQIIFYSNSVVIIQLIQIQIVSILFNATHLINIMYKI